MIKGLNIKRVFWGVLLGALMLSGCGKKESATAVAQKEFIYVPTFSDLEVKSDNIAESVQAGNLLYLLGYSYTEDSSTTELYQINVETGEEKKLTLPIDENAGIQNIETDKNGNLYSLVSVYDQEAGTATYKSMTFNPNDESVVSELDLTQFLGDPSAYVQNAVLDSKGNQYLNINGEKVVCVDQTGKQTGEVKLNTYVQNMFAGHDDSIYVVYYAESGMEIAPLDFAAGKMGASIPNMLSSNDYNSKFAITGEGKILICTKNSLKLCDFAANTSEVLLDWLDSDINSDSISAFGLLEDGRVWVMESNYSESGSSADLVLLTKTKSSDIPDKVQLTYGGLYIDSTVKTKIIAFNKKSTDYHITVREYGAEDYEAGLTQFNTDIASGNGPDIIDFSSISSTQYANKGLLVDLYTYLDADQELNKEDYLENVLKAYETDGKLYTLSPSFYIRTLVGDKATLGDITSWTPDEMIAFAKENCTGDQLLFQSDKSNVLNMLMTANADEFVNWGTGECSFNSQEFMDLLDFANTFPKEYNYSGEDGDGTYAKLQRGDIKLMDNMVSSIQDHQMMEGMFGGEIVYVGYPMLGGHNGNILYSAGCNLGISSKSKNPEAAWEFVKTFFTKEYQEAKDVNRWGFPIMKSALEQVFADSMEKKYTTDENGNQVEQMVSSWGYDDFNMDMYAATKEQVDALRKVIDSADTVIQYDDSLTKMISEETQAFFEGQKNSKDTADVIQSRIKIYVDEHR